MIFHLLGMKRQSVNAAVLRSRISASRSNAVQRQEYSLTFIKRDRWSEDEIAGLPKGEHDYFDRKAGEMFDGPDRNPVYDTLAKAASAFTNSGGGHLVLGATDDGTFDRL